MKDNLFEMLLHLFERSLNQIQQTNPQLTPADENGDSESSSATVPDHLYIKSRHEHSIRVLTYDEQVKLTNASQKLLIRLNLWNIIDSDTLETIIEQLSNSESHVVTLEETKWTIRNVLVPELSAKQIAFLDLVLHQADRQQAIH